MNAQQMVHALCNITIKIKELGLSRHASIKDHIETPYATVWREFRRMHPTPVAVKRIFAMANVKLLPQFPPLVREHTVTTFTEVAGLAVFQTENHWSRKGWMTRRKKWAKAQLSSFTAANFLYNCFGLCFCLA